MKTWIGCSAAIIIFSANLFAQTQKWEYGPRIVLASPIGSLSNTTGTGFGGGFNVSYQESRKLKCEFYVSYLNYVEKAQHKKSMIPIGITQDFYFFTGLFEPFVALGVSYTPTYVSGIENSITKKFGLNLGLGFDCKLNNSTSLIFGTKFNFRFEPEKVVVGALALIILSPFIKHINVSTPPGYVSFIAGLNFKI